MDVQCWFRALRVESCLPTVQHMVHKLVAPLNSARRNPDRNHSEPEPAVVRSALTDLTNPRSVESHQRHSTTRPWQNPQALRTSRLTPRASCIMHQASTSKFSKSQSQSQSRFCSAPERPARTGAQCLVHPAALPVVAFCRGVGVGVGEFPRMASAHPGCWS